MTIDRYREREFRQASWYQEYAPITQDVEDNNRMIRQVASSTITKMANVKQALNTVEANTGRSRTNLVIIGVASVGLTVFLHCLEYLQTIKKS